MPLPEWWTPAGINAVRVDGLRLWRTFAVPNASIENQTGWSLSDKLGDEWWFQEVSETVQISTNILDVVSWVDSRYPMAPEFYGTQLKRSALFQDE